MSKKFIGSFDGSLLEDVDSFLKYYKDTYLCVTYPPQNLFNKWLRVGYLEKQGIVFIDEENDKNYIFYKNTEATFEMKWPSSKLIDKENSICFVCRIPDRQWRKGICRNNLLITPVIDYVTKNAILNNPVNQYTIDLCFEDQSERTILQSVELFKKSNIVGRRLNDDWGVTLPTKASFKGFVLWYHLTPCGIIHVKSKTIVVHHHPMFQEVSDFVRDYEGNKWNLALN